MMDWNNLRTFMDVAKGSSFSGAGRRLKISQSAVSRQIAALEDELRMSLFQRHTTGVQLTDAGHELYGAVIDMSSRFSTALGKINEYREVPEGPLRVTTSVAFGSAWLGARINRFLKAYPNISVSLMLMDNAEYDLAQGDAQVAIRFRPPRQLNLIQRKLMSVRYHLFASRAYLDDHGIPESADDLDRHKLIVYGEDIPAPMDDINWLLTVGRGSEAPRKPALTVNNVYGILSAVINGAGIAALPYYLSADQPDLVEVLPRLKGPKFDVYFVYPEEMRHSKRICVLRDFLLDEVNADKELGAV
jgi:DNA-binding transcriptional LysR family regulator